MFKVDISYSQASTVLKRFEFSHGQMGTIFNIVCYGNNEEYVRERVNEAFSIIDSLNQIFSDYIPDSELNTLCEKSGTGKFIPVSMPLFKVIYQSLYWSKLSQGAFDITVGPYTQLWRRAKRQEKLPDKDNLLKASNSIGYQYIKLNISKRAIFLKKKNMQLDLGGIAKGYTVDSIYSFLKVNKLPFCLVDGGGDIYAGCIPPDAKGWKIAFEDLEKIKKSLFISQKAIATSGDLYRFFEYKGVKYSHIINPRTGFGITIPRTVTVIAPNATEADALATILSVCGPKSGFKLIRKLKQVNALIIQEEGDETKRYEFGYFDFNNNGIILN